MVRFTLRLGGVAALVALAACADRSPTAVPARDPAVPVHGGYLTAEFRCSVAVATRQTRCVEARPAGVRGDLILGGGYAQLNSRNVSYDGIQDFTFEVAVTNLIHQQIGTTDGSTAASPGIRVFFALEPYVTAGTGTVTVVPDGYDAFTASNQPYYEYDEVLEYNVQSGWHGWLFQMPPTVTHFAFTVYVSAPVQYPNGWIDVSLGSLLVVNGTGQMSATTYDQYGNVVTGSTYTWSSSDPSVASVSSTGVVTGNSTGHATITASSGSRTGSAEVTVF
jgi:hypothetical protein